MHALTQGIFLNIFHTDTLIFYSFQLTISLFFFFWLCHQLLIFLYSCTPVILSTDICVQNETMSAGKITTTIWLDFGLFGVIHSLILGHAPLA